MLVTPAHEDAHSGICDAIVAGDPRLAADLTTHLAAFARDMSPTG